MGWLRQSVRVQKGRGVRRAPILCLFVSLWRKKKSTKPPLPKFSFVPRRFFLSLGVLLSRRPQHCDTIERLCCLLAIAFVVLRRLIDTIVCVRSEIVARCLLVGANLLDTLYFESRVQSGARVSLVVQDAVTLSCLDRYVRCMRWPSSPQWRWRRPARRRVAPASVVCRCELDGDGERKFGRRGAR